MVRGEEPDLPWSHDVATERVMRNGAPAAISRQDAAVRNRRSIHKKALRRRPHGVSLNSENGLPDGRRSARAVSPPNVTSAACEFSGVVRQAGDNNIASCGSARDPPVYPDWEATGEVELEVPTHPVCHETYGNR